MATKAKTTETPTPPPQFDPSGWTVNTDRTPPKITKTSGADRTPFIALVKALEPMQVVEIPNPLSDKEAKSLENIVREVARDQGLSVSFLVDAERNATDGNRPEGTNHYAWFVKGPYQKRGPKAAKA